MSHGVSSVAGEKLAGAPASGIDCWPSPWHSAVGCRRHRSWPEAPSSRITIRLPDFLGVSE